ncbi:MAG: efflux RND transporter permease subunit [Phycisphaerales bacterium]
MRDVARVELGAANASQSSALDGMPSVGLAIFQLPGSNALDVADRVRARMDRLAENFPQGLEYAIAYDTTPYIRESVVDVVRTLVVAVALVALVVFLFLQSWRAAIIPLIAVPVAIVGTFAAMAALGFSLNNISLFGLVLAIGIVVDDAIVVVENVQRWLAQGFPPREAARRAMAEVSGPIVAVAVVLCAVFVPCALVGGIPGQLFRQFAVTIAVSTVISAFNSLTLSPALAAILLARAGEHTQTSPRRSRLLSAPFRAFNRAFDAATTGYARFVGLAVRGSVVVLVLYLALLGATRWLFGRVPMGFVPQQDQGWLLVNVQLPDAASLERTQEVMAKASEIALATPGVAHTAGISGLSLLMMTGSSNFGSMFIVLEPFEKRRAPELGAAAIVEKLKVAYAAAITDAELGVLGAPPVPGLGVAAGFKLMVQDREALGFPGLQQGADALIADVLRNPGIMLALTPFRADTPQLGLEIDRTKARMLGVSMKDVSTTLDAALGSTYVQNFSAFGRSWQVIVQADGMFRVGATDVGMLQVRNDRGDMVPLATLVQPNNATGPVMVTRYNLFPAAPILAAPRPGTGAGTAMAILDDAAAATLPPQLTTEWTELMFMQRRAGNAAMWAFAIGVALVFLALAALYERWTLPLAVVLVVPMCLMSALAGVAWRGLSIDLFVQIGLIVLIGLACKNAILIVEFARRLRSDGAARHDAAVEAARVRLRPIVMTSLAFILGVFPMVIAHGAGAEMRWSLGTAVFGGMIGVTLFGLVLTPVFFVVVDAVASMAWLARLRERAGASPALAALAGAVVGAAMTALLWRSGFLAVQWAVVAGAALGLPCALLVARRRSPRALPSSHGPGRSAMQREAAT